MTDVIKHKTRKYTADEYRRIGDVALAFGLVTGALLSPDIVEYFEARDVPRKELDECYKALIKVAKGFYRDPK